MIKKVRLLALLVIPAMISSCTYNHFIIQPRISEVNVSDLRTAYAVDETFADSSELTITAKYNNGELKEYTLADISSLSLTYVKDGKNVNQDIKEKFTVVGEYKFYVEIENVKSNTLTFEVLEHHVFVESLSLSGESTIQNKTSTSLSLSVQPENYTTAIEYEYNDPYLVKAVKTNSGLDIYALKAGNLVITISSYKNETEKVSSTFELSITPTMSVVHMNETYRDYSKNTAYGNSYSVCPSTGNPKLLVIPVWFSDSNKIITKSRDHVRDDIRKAYFGTPEDTGWNSVASYYNYESHGRLNLSGTISNWYECGISYKTVGKANYSTSNLVNNAVKWYFNNNPSDNRRNYDSDNDGFLDGIMLIYAAPDYTQSSDIYNLTNLWAYCSWMNGTVVDGIKPCVYFWASYDFMYNKERAKIITGNYYGNGDNNHCAIDAHTFIHEMGHVFGLDDYYDYSGQYNPACGFSMQDYNVGGHDPYSVMALGWADAIIPDSSQTIAISEFQYSHDLILLSPSFNEYNSPFDEYLLIELYSPNGLNDFDSKYKYNSQYPQGPRVPGIRLWHVDARLVKYTSSDISISESASTHQGNIATAMSNTYFKSESEKSYDYISKLGKDYADYNLLQMIRNNKTATYHSSTTLVKSDMFLAGNSFDMSTFNRQFVNGDKLNSSKSLGWSFTVDKIELVSGVYNATITVTKN